MRLTKDIKTAILNAALKKAGIPDREVAIRSRYAAWAEAVRVRYVTPENLQLIESARLASNAVSNELKLNSFRPNTSAAIEYANVAGQRRTVYFCGAIRSEQRDKNKHRQIAPDHGSVIIEAGDPLAEQLHATDHDAQQVELERQELTVSLNAVLDSVTTDKRLVEVWPEAAAFIPAAERAATSNLPALPIADLNRMIGLP